MIIQLRSSLPPPAPHTHTRILHMHTYHTNAHISTDESTQVLSANPAATVVYNAINKMIQKKTISTLKMMTLMNHKFHHMACLLSPCKQSSRCHIIGNDLPPIHSLLKHQTAHKRCACFHLQRTL